MKPHRRQRERLWRLNPHCFWCGKLTRLQVVFKRGAKIADDVATVDHVWSKLDPRRKPGVTAPNHVLACRACNQRRCTEEQRALPKAELHRRSGHWPKASIAA